VLWTELSTTFELEINLKTAKDLGLAIRQSFFIAGEQGYPVTTRSSGFADFTALRANGCFFNHMKLGDILASRRVMRLFPGPTCFLDRATTLVFAGAQTVRPKWEEYRNRSTFHCLVCDFVRDSKSPSTKEIS
jgi:hypothetical protein